MDVVILYELLRVLPEALEIVFGVLDHGVGRVAHRKVGLPVILLYRVLDCQMLTNLKVVVEPLVDVRV